MIAFYNFILAIFLNLLTFSTWLVPGHSAALGIILFTLVVRFLLLIPSKQALQAQRKMTQLQPLLHELQEEYKDDKQALAAAQMELYKKNGVNPFGSCLPILTQLVVFFFLYRAVGQGLNLHSPLLYGFIPHPFAINNSFLGLNIFQPDRTFILVIIAAALQLIQGWMMLPPKPAPDEVQDATQNMSRQLTFLSPVFLLVIGFRVVSGVVIYWIVSTLFTIGQQYLIKRDKTRLQGVGTVVSKAEKEHPEHKKEMEEVKHNLEGTAELVETPSVENKKGVTITVRKKGK